ncbi:MFS transporter [Smaragdicoccus niigatensis]|uniref:MFS transporter n=1 Tax=Smaragdicoccus niigatensis TaxID=359359 RepID=UPI00138AB778|nr:MFS transporter [Smaragdicoccus niigatensis]
MATTHLMAPGHLAVNDDSAVEKLPMAVLTAMCLALVLVVASVTAINLTLPDLALGLHASNTQLTWVADGYTVTLAALVLPLGALGDRIGRRRLLIAGAAVFAIASFFAGRVDTVEQLIGFRVAMGTGAAMIMPGTLATITAVFPAELRSKGVAVWSGCAGAGAIFGLLVSGFVLEHSDWRMIFTISAVAAAMAGLGALIFAPETRDENPPKADYFGSLFTGLSIGSLVYAIINGARRGWTDHIVIAMFVLAVVSIVAYVFTGLRTKHSVLDPRFFARRGFLTGSVTVVMQFMAVMGFFFVGLQYLLLIRDFSPLEAAVALLPVAGVMLPVAALTPTLLRFVSVNIATATGLFLMAGSMVYASTLTATSSYDQFLVGLLVSGVGLGITSSTGTNLIVSSLSPQQQGTASAVNDSTREVGSAVGIALMGSIFATNYRSNLPDLSMLKPDVATHIRDSAPSGITITQHMGPAAANLAEGVRTAFMHGFSTSLMIVSIFLFVGGVVTLFAPKRIPVGHGH